MTYNYVRSLLPEAWRDYQTGKIAYDEMVRKFYNTYYNPKEGLND